MFLLFVSSQKSCDVRSKRFGHFFLYVCVFHRKYVLAAIGLLCAFPLCLHRVLHGAQRARHHVGNRYFCVRLKSLCAAWPLMSRSRCLP